MGNKKKSLQALPSDTFIEMAIAFEEAINKAYPGDEVLIQTDMFDTRLGQQITIKVLRDTEKNRERFEKWSKENG